MALKWEQQSSLPGIGGVTAKDAGTEILDIVRKADYDLFAAAEMLKKGNWYSDDPAAAQAASAAGQRGRSFFQAGGIKNAANQIYGTLREQLGRDPSTDEFKAASKVFVESVDLNEYDAMTGFEFREHIQTKVIGSSRVQSLILEGKVAEPTPEPGVTDTGVVMDEIVSVFGMLNPQEQAIANLATSTDDAVTKITNLRDQKEQELEDEQARATAAYETAVEETTEEYEQKVADVTRQLATSLEAYQIAGIEKITGAMQQQLEAKGFRATGGAYQTKLAEITGELAKERELRLSGFQTASEQQLLQHILGTGRDIAGMKREEIMRPLQYGLEYNRMLEEQLFQEKLQRLGYSQQEIMFMKQADLTKWQQLTGQSFQEVQAGYDRAMQEKLAKLQQTPKTDVTSLFLAGLGQGVGETIIPW